MSTITFAFRKAEEGTETAPKESGNRSAVEHQESPSIGLGKSWQLICGV